MRFLIRDRIPGREPSTLTTEHLMVMAALLVLEDTGQYLFYDGTIRDKEDYLGLLVNPHTMAFGLFSPDGNNPLGLCWLNNFLGHASLMHFIIFGEGLPHKRQIAQSMLGHLLFGQGSQISGLIGITPKPFRHAWKFALESGFERIGILPRACWVASHNRMVDAVLTLCTPESFHKTYNTVQEGGPLWAEAEEKTRNPK